MFVVRRPFKNFGKTYTAGTVIADPAVIKRFRGKLAEGKIINVTEQAYDDTAKYFKEKYGVNLPPFTTKSEETPVAEETPAKPKAKAATVAKASAVPTK